LIGMSKLDLSQLKDLSRTLRYLILSMSSRAGSGHPTSSLSAVELMVGVFFGGRFKYDLNDPLNKNNDRVVFSKGHASPLFYALWALAENGGSGKVSSGQGVDRVTVAELDLYRKFGSRLEGHPTPRFPYTEAATGSLGQGLSVGVGLALKARYVDQSKASVYVLLGDSEMVEGSVWEAAALASHYKLSNLVALVDINRLGQTGSTMHGHDLSVYKKKFEAFGWQTVSIQGHSIPAVLSAIDKKSSNGRPLAVLAKTIKGKGVSFIEDQPDWHGRVLGDDELQQAFLELGSVDIALKGLIPKPKLDHSRSVVKRVGDEDQKYTKGEMVATRRAYGEGLVYLYQSFPQLVALDGEVNNSTFASIFAERYPERYFEMFVAEQNMVGVAIGMSRLGCLPFVSTFAAFFSRAFDQIRMARYSEANIKFIGSHAGVSIGPDGSSQMGLEDLAMFRSIPDALVLYPADAVAVFELMKLAARYQGLVYIRTTRMETPVIYNQSKFKAKLGGSYTVKQSPDDVVTVIAAGVTLHESLTAYRALKAEGIKVRVIDLYCVKPLDRKTLVKAVKETGSILTVEDHYREGGIGEAVGAFLAEVGLEVKFTSLAVSSVPQSGSPAENLSVAGIDSSAIVSAVKDLIAK